MKRLFLSLFFICFIGQIIAQQSIMDLRKLYMTALKDCSNVETVYERFEEVDNPSAGILAYKGALEAIMTKTTWNVIKKISWLKKSEKTFTAAVEKNPNSVEVRFMRLAVQHEIPSYLGFSDNMQEDKKFIIKNLYRFKTELIGSGILKEILRFVNESNRFTKQEIEIFEDNLALY